jgi:DNA-binding IclR family transcriptional regulator
LSPPVVRVMRILDFLASHPRERFTVSELARRLEISTATCHAIVVTLVRSAHLTRGADGRVQLGPAMIPVGDAARSWLPVLQLARSELEATAAQFDVALVATVRAHDELVHLMRFGGASLFDPMIQPALRLPLEPPLGTSFFAWEPDAEIQAWIARLRERGLPVDRYLDWIAVARRLGFVAGRDQPGSRALSDAVNRTETDAVAARAGIEERIEAIDPSIYLVDTDAEGDRPTFVSSPVFDGEGRTRLVITAELTPGRDIDFAALAARMRDLTMRMTAGGEGVVPDSWRALSR